MLQGETASANVPGNGVNPLRADLGPCGTCPIRALTAYGVLGATGIERIARLRKGFRTYRARAVLAREGDVLTEIYTLYEGWVFRFKLLPDGRRQILSFLLPGDTIGFPLVYATPLHFSIQTLTDVTVCVFDARALTDFLASCPAALLGFGERSLRDAMAQDDLMTDLGRRSATARIARLMLDLHRRLRARGIVAGPTMPFPLRQRDIADALGLTPIHVNRVMGTLSKVGVLSLDAGTLTILEPERLERIAMNLGH